jgi:hypothetical protein
MLEKVLAVTSLLAVVLTSLQAVLNVSIKWIRSAFTGSWFTHVLLLVMMCNRVIAFSSVMLEVGQRGGQSVRLVLVSLALIGCTAGSIRNFHA